MTDADGWFFSLANLPLFATTFFPFTQKLEKNLNRIFFGSCGVAVFRSVACILLYEHVSDFSLQPNCPKN